MNLLPPNTSGGGVYPLVFASERSTAQMWWINPLNVATQYIEVRHDDGSIARYEKTTSTLRDVVANRTGQWWQLVWTRDPFDNQTSYEYGAYGQLLTVTYPDGLIERWNWTPAWISGWSGHTGLEISYENNSSVEVAPSIAMVFKNVPVEGVANQYHKYFDGQLVAYFAQTVPVVGDPIAGQLYDTGTTVGQREVTELVYGDGAWPHNVTEVRKKWFSGTSIPDSSTFDALPAVPTLATVYDSLGRVFSQTVAPSTLPLQTVYSYSTAYSYPQALLPSGVSALNTVTVEGPDHDKEIREYDPNTGRIYKAMVDPGVGGRPRQGEGAYLGLPLLAEPERVAVMYVYDDTCVCQKPLHVLTGPVNSAGNWVGSNPARSQSYTYDPDTKQVLTVTQSNPSTLPGDAATITTAYEYYDWQGAWGPAWVTKVTRGDGFVVDYEYPNLRPRLDSAHGSMMGQVRTIYRSVTTQLTETGTEPTDIVELVTFNIEGNPGLGSIPYSGPASKFPRGQVRLVDDADGVTTGYLYSSVDGSPTSVYRSGGALPQIQTVVAYDIWGRLTGYTLNAGSSSESVWSVVQDARLRTRTVECTTISSIKSQFFYDKWGHLAVAEHKNRNSDGQAPARHGAGSSSARDWVRTEYVWRYSWLDEVRRDRRPLDEGAGSPFGGTNPLMAVTSYSFSGRDLTVAAPSGAETVLTYDGYGTLFKTVVRDGAASGADLEVSRTYLNEFLEPIRIVAGSPSLGAGSVRVTEVNRDPATGAVRSVAEPTLPSSSLPPGYTGGSTGGAVHSYEMDRLGRVWEQRVSNGGPDLLVVRHIKDQLGRTRLVERESSTTPADTTWAYTTYATGRLSRIAKAQRAEGPVVTYQYDDMARVSLISDGPTNPNTTRYTYVAGTDLVDEVTRELANPTGPSTSYVTKASYDALGRPTLIQEGFGSTIVRGHQQFYNSLGGVDKYIDPMGKVQKFLGDALGRAVEHARVGDGGDVILNTAIYVDSGLSASQTRVSRSDDLLHATVSTYDFAGRMFLEQRPGASATIPAPGSPEPHTTLLTFDALSQVTNRYDGDGGNTAFYYDALGRLIQRELVGIQDDIATFNTRDVIKRDALGRVVDSVMWGSTNGSAANGQPANHASIFARELESFDGLGRQTQTQYLFGFVANSPSVTSSYSDLDGFRSGLSVADGITTGGGVTQPFALTVAPDALRRIAGMDWERASAAGAGVQPLADYTWRGGFPVTREVSYGASTPVKVGTTSYTYDDIGRTTTIEDVVAGGGSSAVTNRFDYYYDLANNLKREKYGKVGGAAGDKFTYDAYHRLQNAYMGVSSTWIDDDDDPTGYDSLNAAKREAFSLDGAHNRLDVEVKQGASTTTLDYTLDAYSNRYVKANNAVGIEHDGRGNLIFDGRFYYRYDFLNRLQEVWRILVAEEPPAEGEEGARYAPIESVEALDTSRKAVIDDVYQMLSRVPREHKNATFRERLRTPIPGGVLQLNGSGQQGTGGGGKLGFLLPANLELVALYGYDIYNRRTMRVVVGEDTYLSTYDGWAEVCEHSLNFSTLNAEPTKQFVRGNGLDEILSYRKRVGTPGSYTWEDYFIQHGGQDTPSRLLDSSGTVVERYEYDAYGKATIYEETTLTAIKWQASRGLPFLWKGVRYDPETGNHYMRNRYYSAATGRFLSQDPIGVWGDTLNAGNGYAYVGCMPGVFGDPLGLQAPARDPLASWGDGEGGFRGGMALWQSYSNRRQKDPNTPFYEAYFVGAVAAIPLAWWAAPAVASGVTLCAEGAVAADILLTRAAASALAAGLRLAGAAFGSLSGAATSGFLFGVTAVRNCAVPGAQLVVYWGRQIKEDVPGFLQGIVEGLAPGPPDHDEPSRTAGHLLGTIIGEAGEHVGMMIPAVTHWVQRLVPW